MKRYVKCAKSGPVDEEAVRELVLYITNDGDLYRSLTTSIIDNKKSKRKTGKYDDTLAVKGWMHLADAGVRKYDKEFGSGGGSLTFCNKATREAIAAELKEYYEDEITYEEDVKSSVTVKNKKVTAAKVYSDGFSNYTPWSGAVDTWNNLEQYDKLDALEAFIDDAYYNSELGEGVINETELNDLLWFEPETVYEAVGLYYDDETGEVSDEPFNEYDEDDIY